MLSVITVADAEYTKILLHKFSIPFIEKRLTEMLGAFIIYKGCMRERRYARGKGGAIKQK